MTTSYAGASPVDQPVVQPVPERFCGGVKGREQCDDCAGRYVPAPGWSVPLRILAHQPWPFEPCPHYVPPIDCAVTK